MSWFPLEETITDHPKILQAGHKGFALYVASLCYASKAFPWYWSAEAQHDSRGRNVGLHRSPPVRRVPGLRRPSGLPGPLHHPQGPLRWLPLRAVRSLLLALLERCRHFAEDGLCPAPTPLGTTWSQPTAAGTATQAKIGRKAMIIEMDPEVAAEMGLRDESAVKNVFTESAERRPMYGVLSGVGYLILPDWSISRIKLDQCQETTIYGHDMSIRLTNVVTLECKGRWLTPWDRHLLQGGQP